VDLAIQEKWIPPSAKGWYFMRHFFLVCTALTVSFCWASEVQASGILFGNDDNGTLRNDFNGTVGGSFKVVSAISQVVSLGFYDYTTTGGAGAVLNTSHDVAIWDSTGTLLGKVTVAPTDALVAGFRYHALATPITLTVGATYFLGALVTSGDGDQFRDQYQPGSGSLAMVSTDSHFGNFQASYHWNVGVGGSISDPTNIGSPNAIAFGVANLQYAPEPSAITMLGTGVLGLAAYGWRRRSRTIEEPRTK
jgi:hypothetical protein